MMIGEIISGLGTTGVIIVLGLQVMFNKKFEAVNQRISKLENKTAYICGKVEAKEHIN